MDKKTNFLKTLKEKLAKSMTMEKEEHQKVNFNGKEYYLEELYQLSKDDENHICILEYAGINKVPDIDSWTLGEIGYDHHKETNHDIYTDIVTGDTICYSGYEKELGYNVKDVSLEEFNEFINNTEAMKK